jgi:hypothetical protein
MLSSKIGPPRPLWCGWVVLEVLGRRRGKGFLSKSAYFSIERATGWMRKNTEKNSILSFKLLLLLEARSLLTLGVKTKPALRAVHRFDWACLEP